MKRDFLAVTDFSRDEIEATFDIARKLKAEVRAGKPHHYFSGETMAMIFAKPSARTWGLRQRKRIL